jgi:hypothetical protein
MIWSFFGSSHGKGPHDGACAIVKGFLKKEQQNVHAEKLQNVKEVVTFLKKHLSYRLETTLSGERKPFKRFLCHVKANDVIWNNSSFNCDPIKGTIKLHSIWEANKHNLTQLMVRDLACYCIFCLNHRWEECKNVC